VVAKEKVSNREIKWFEVLLSTAKQQEAKQREPLAVISGFYDTRM